MLNNLVTATLNLIRSQLSCTRDYQLFNFQAIFFNNSWRSTLQSGFKNWFQSKTSRTWFFHHHSYSEEPRLSVKPTKTPSSVSKPFTSPSNADLFALSFQITNQLFVYSFKHVRLLPLDTELPKMINSVRQLLALKNKIIDWCSLSFSLRARWLSWMAYCKCPRKSTI